jgi:hypothetical protein
MSEVVEGGNPDAVIIDMIIQEVDADRNVVFVFRTWDHFDPLDSVGYNLTGRRIDYVHTNSVERDFDGNIIMSHRHLDEITKVSRETGDIMWHMGGKHNEFTLVGDTQWFTHQHSARRQANGHLTVFDNGNNSDPRESRAIEYEVDEENMTAMGNVHRQPNGNSVIGWGTGRPNVTEVRPDGSTAFELQLPQGMFSYRAFRFQWNGVAARPDLWATLHDGVLALNFTRFGDTDVASYRIYRGDSPGAGELERDTSAHRILVHDFDAGETLYFRVTAVDGLGNESPYSNEISVTPEFSDHLVGASLRVTPRTLNVASEGNWIQASVELAGECMCSVADTAAGIVLNGSVEPDRVKVKHKGRDVTGLDLKFPREAVAAALEPGDDVEVTVSGRIGASSFETRDRIRVIAPGDDDTALDDDGSGGEPGTGADDEGAFSRVASGLRAIRPNPFNPRTVIHYHVASPGEHVTIAVFDVAGRLVRTLVDGPAAGGDASVTWDGRDGGGARLASGVYFCRLRAGGVSETRKMVLMK